MGVNKLKLKNSFIIKPTYHSRRKSEILFILSTGRCGSRSVAGMFNQYSNFAAFHENIPELIHLSTELAEHPEKKEQIYEQLRIIFRNKYWEGEKKQIVVISDHRLWNFVDFLAKYFPKSKFIHLIRNPYDSIRSYMPRGWYSKEEFLNPEYLHAKHRLQGNNIGEFKNEEWGELTRLEKCAWYWIYINSSIDKQLQHLNSERKSVIKLESLRDDLEEFLNKQYKIPQTSLKNEFLNQGEQKKNDNLSNENIQDALKKFRFGSVNKFYPGLNG